MTFAEAYATHPLLMLEGALGERLKREYGHYPDETLGLAGMIYNDSSRLALSTLWRQYRAIAAACRLPFLATTPTRRANRERVAGSFHRDSIIADNVQFLREIQESSGQEMYVGGLVGCKGDAYTGEDALTEGEALEFHLWSAERFAKAGADFLYAGIMPTLPEAAGLAKACDRTEVPYIISFTVRGNGRLPDGASIHDAISRIDAATRRHPVCYMANCVHPNILAEALSQTCNRTDLVRTRFRGIQANASPLPPEALDGSAALHSSNPTSLADAVASIGRLVPLKIVGGCCGTDASHMSEIAERFSATP